MTAKLTASLRQAPATVPALAALVPFVVWATSQAGYPLAHWAPMGLIVIALLAIALAAVRLRWRDIPLAVRLAVGCLAAYTALSFLSIAWAHEQGIAWEGADRTLLYLLVFSLFACWRQRGASAALVLVAWTLALIVLAFYVELHIDGASAGALRSLMPGGRLIDPSGYANANAAQWLMAFWPALLLARSDRLPWAGRGVLAGGAVLLACVALLSQSRGSLYATPVLVVLVFLLIPARVRTFVTLAPVALGVAAAAPAVLRVGDHLDAHGDVIPAHVHTTVAASLLAGLLVGVIVTAGAALETGTRLSPRARVAFARGARTLTVAAVLATVAGGLAVAGNPVHRLESAWHSFKGGYGEDRQKGSRLISGLGSNRYDFYRVALDEFLAHPLVGIGADNFQQQYLVHGRSNETPRYPHSVELRTLVQTGLLGALLAVVGLAAALAAAARAIRRADPLARHVAAAALCGFAYWVVHGSFDWFWEFAGLGAPAFALLGLACALAPARGGEEAPAPASRQWPLAAVASLIALAAALSLAAPWLSQLEVQRAAAIWTHAPAAAYRRLHDAARLDPLSDEAYLVAGSIALRYGELTRADQQFAQALARSPNDAYATLERGAIAAQQGRHAQALRLLTRAAKLEPRDELTREALKLVREDRTVRISELDRLIVRKARQLV
jgi:tetratricopeptide (TPR) repeat protein/predicted secreted protein